ncbi:MAG TPA: hypothetical protein VF746_04260 [Longimicrobium sp.]|jgi:hypothetical protein
MKKLSLALAALALALPAAARAQTATATVNASATVVASLTAATTHQLKFGTLALGASSTLASSGASQAALSGLTTAGLGQIQVGHNSSVGVTATVPAVLTNALTGTTLGFSASCATATTSGGSGTAVASCASFSFTAAAPGTVQSTYVLVGGTVTGSAAAGIGTFEGDLAFTFTATN